MMGGHQLQICRFVREDFIGSFESGWSIMGMKEGMMGEMV